MKTLVVVARTLWPEPWINEATRNQVPADLGVSEVLTVAGDPVAVGVGRWLGVPVRDYPTWRDALDAGGAEALVSIDDGHAMVLAGLVAEARARGLRVEDSRAE